jgi:hypothetical protein
MLLSGRQTQFYIDIIYGVVFAAEAEEAVAGEAHEAEEIVGERSLARSASRSPAR